MKKLRFILFWCVFSVHAESFNDGLDAYNRQNYAQAYRIWQNLLSSNTRLSDTLEIETIQPYEKAAAEYGLGLMAWQGLGVKQSYYDAFHWLSLAANKGHKDAALKLAVLYLDGLSGIKDEAKAGEWMLLAANYDLPDAQYNVATMYLNGTGLPKDKEKALFWLRKAADAGIDDAKKLLARLTINSKQTSLGQAVEIVLPENSADSVSEIETQKTTVQSENTHLPDIPKSEQVEPEVSSFGIQFSASIDKNAAIKTLKNYPDAKLYIKEVQAQRWYVVLQCCFKTRADANLVLGKLPLTYQVNKPFVVSTAAVSLVE